MTTEPAAPLTPEQFNRACDLFGRALSEGVASDARQAFLDRHASDGNNNRIHYSYDRNADGTPDYEESYQNDAFGNVLVEVEDSNANGNPNWIDTFSYRRSNFEGWDLFRRLDD